MTVLLNYTVTYYYEQDTGILVKGNGTVYTYEYPSMTPSANATYNRMLVAVNLSSVIDSYPFAIFVSLVAIPIVVLYWKNARNFKKARKSREIPCNRD